MRQKAEQAESFNLEETSGEGLREELYEQLDVTSRERAGIRYLLPILSLFVQTESRYDIDTRSKILAEISLIRAYIREPKFRMFAFATVLLVAYDLLHSLNPAIYGILLGALATLNGFIASLRSPAMMAAELDGVEDEDGMPADYRSKALSSVNTNITLFLFVIAVGVQLLVTGSFIQGELLTENIGDGIVYPGATASILALIPIIVAFLPRNRDED